MATVERFGPGASLANPQPGDFILTHEDSDLFARLIHHGQALRFRKEPQYTRWNHAALIADPLGGIIEALSSGVCYRHLADYEPREYLVVHVDMSKEDSYEVVTFANSCLHEGYGWGQIASIALSLLTGSKFSFGRDDETICSGLVARALEHGGVILPFDAGHAMPADLAKFYEVQ